MASPLQIEANRRNSQLSTGPRSQEGKAVSRFNALKSGIDARAQVIPGEDPAELEALAQGYHEQFQPASPFECFLVDSLIYADWQLRRLHRVEAQLWAEGSPGETYIKALDVFTRLQRRIDSSERSYYRALSQLQRLRASATPVPLPPAPSQPPEELLSSPELASFRDVSDPAAPAPASDPALSRDFLYQTPVSDAIPIDNACIS